MKIRRILKKVPGLQTLHYKIMQAQAMNKWKKQGRPVPPPHRVKSDAVLEYAKKFDAHNLVETGTFLGHMIDACKKSFSTIISIELAKNLADDAQSRFRNYRNIKVLQGDSSRLLPEILKDLSGKTIFWLDAHYSGYVTAKGEVDTPIMSEVKTLATWNQPETVLLIDDARLFTGQEYPEMEEFKNFVRTQFPKHNVSVENDIIRVVPNNY